MTAPYSMNYGFYKSIRIVSGYVTANVIQATLASKLIFWLKANLKLIPRKKYRSTYLVEISNLNQSITFDEIIITFVVAL